MGGFIVRVNTLFSAALVPGCTGVYAGATRLQTTGVSYSYQLSACSRSGLGISPSEFRCGCLCTLTHITRLPQSGSWQRRPHRHRLSSSSPPGLRCTLTWPACSSGHRAEHPADAPPPVLSEKKRNDFSKLVCV